MLIVKTIAVKTKQLYTKIYYHFHAQIKPSQQILSHQYFQQILQLTCQLIFSWTYSFHNLINSPTSHNLSHSHSQLLGIQINPLSHIPLSINYLHSHLYLSLFQSCLPLQTLAPSLNLHLKFCVILCFLFYQFLTLD